MLQTYCIVALTCRAREYEPNATWTGQIGVETKILWLQQKQWQTCK
jgi:hypothetical protein